MIFLADVNGMQPSHPQEKQTPFCHLAFPNISPAIMQPIIIVDEAASPPER